MTANGADPNAALIDFTTPRVMTNEGFDRVARWDSEGQCWTLGYGRADEDVKEGMTCTQMQAVGWLKGSLQARCEGLDEALPWWRDLDQVRQSVLLEMAYNMGMGWPAGTHGKQDRGRGLLSFQSMLRDAHDGLYGQAAAAMLMSRWAKPFPQGVGDRAMRLSILMKQGANPT